MKAKIMFPRRIIVFLGTLNFISFYCSSVHSIPSPRVDNQSYIYPIKAVPLVVIKSQLAKYFELKPTQPQAAKDLLILILKEDPQNLIANNEMGYLLLKNNELNEAMQYFYKVLWINPYDKTAIRQISAIQQELQIKKIKEEIDKTNGLFFSQSPLVIKAQMNKYFELKNTQPQIAKELLMQILKEDPKYLIANKEMGYLLLNDKQLKAAMEYFYNVLRLTPYDETIIKQVGAIQEQLKVSEIDNYFALKKTDPQKAKQLLLKMLAEKPKDPVLNAEMGYYLLNEKNDKEALVYFKKSLEFDPANKAVLAQIKVIETGIQAKALPPLSEEEQLFNQYYQLKKNNPQQAQSVLGKLISKYPRNIQAQREMSFLLINENKLALALEHLYVVEQLAPNDYGAKLQIGYVLASLDHPVKAYDYFYKTTKSLDPALRLKGNQAMTNLGGMQTKFLPKPWFADLYLYPLLYSRFDLVILPGIGRIGRTFGKKQQLEVYAINRTTWDNRSGAASAVGGLPQVFDDDAVITSFGARFAPFFNSSIPALQGLKLYADVGRAYNIIKMPPHPNRRWRNDFRGGLLYWFGWGAKHEYVDKITWPFKPFGNAYSDITFYTRYNDNIIGYYSIRQGLRLVEYQTGEINLYGRVRGSFDKNHEFFNNFVDVGPGIEIIPNNRYNFSIRFEPLRGYYIPVKSPSPNPYGPRYGNNLLIFEYYVLF
jgi:tetratricopeptide (TPR) repeat protein